MLRCVMFKFNNRPIVALSPSFVQIVWRGTGASGVSRHSNVKENERDMLSLNND